MVDVTEAFTLKTPPEGLPDGSEPHPFCRKLQSVDVNYCEHELEIASDTEASKLRTGAGAAAVASDAVRRLGYGRNS